jgi:hypothetical protein
MIWFIFVIVLALSIVYRSLVQPIEIAKEKEGDSFGRFSQAESLPRKVSPMKAKI